MHQNKLSRPKQGYINFIKKLGNSNISNQYKNEENSSKDKFIQLKNGITFKDETYNLESVIDESNSQHCWTEQEWGFPKGRRNFQESDIQCACREFEEETGLTDKDHSFIKQRFDQEYAAYRDSAGIS